MTQPDRTTDTGRNVTELLLDGTIWTRKRALAALAAIGSPLTVAGLDYYLSRLTSTGELVKLPGFDPADQKSAMWQARGDIGALDRYILQQVQRSAA